MPCVLAGILCLALPVEAQRPASLPSAPVPPQVAHAKKVFIINAEGTNDPRIAKFLGGPNGVYDQFYADVKRTGHFEIVSGPAEADVALQVTLSVYEVVSGYSRFKLSILDPKTNILLWTISEPVEGAILTKTAQRNIAQSLARLTQDLAVVAAGQ
jgi:hypothetical protein